MSMRPHTTFIARLANRPVPVLLGVAVGFLSCCIAGRLAARQQQYENFVRFHRYISPEVNFYPSFSQVLNLAREHVQPGKVLVVVGGNSIFHGVGQREAEIWTRHLQDLLGERYTVLNLALKGTAPFEFGGLIAERLAAEGAPVVFVTVALDGKIDAGMAGDWEGRLNQYFFWDAWGKGLLPPDEKRDQWLKDDISWKTDKTVNRRESRYRGLIDGATYAGDLWTSVAYRYLCSVWSHLKYEKFWDPHKNQADPDPGSTLPPERYNREADIPSSHKIMQSWIHTPAADDLYKGEGDDRLAKRYRLFAPTALRHRILFVFRYEGPYYLERLPPDERERYRRVIRRLPEAIDGDDFRVRLVGENYTVADYIDRSHFSEQGGRKLAADLAPTVRSMAVKLYGVGEPKLQGAKP